MQGTDHGDPIDPEALHELEEALVRGEDLGGQESAGGGRRRQLRERLEREAGGPDSHPTVAAWVEAREARLRAWRVEVSREIEELRGQEERQRLGWRRYLLLPAARQLRRARIRKVLDLLEIQGRLAELHAIRRSLPGSGSGPGQTEASG